MKKSLLGFFVVQEPSEQTMKFPLRDRLRHLVTVIAIDQGWITVDFECTSEHLLQYSDLCGSCAGPYHVGTSPAEQTASHDEIGGGAVDFTKIARARTAETSMEISCDIKDLETDYFCGHVSLKVEVKMDPA